MPETPIYLDHSATTPMDSRVFEAMKPYLQEAFGNSESAHMLGRNAEFAVEQARETIANILNCKPAEIIFTSGGSESDNLAVRGVGWFRRAHEGQHHLVTTPVEHSAVTRTVQQMADYMGFYADWMRVDDEGKATSQVLDDTITDSTAVISAIYANNEVGTINPLAELSEIAHARGTLLHTDAVQAAGQLSLDVQALGVDLMSLSAHKFYGPKGVGLLYKREGVELLPAQTGGSHEDGQRAGTLNTAGIIGMAEALRLAQVEQVERTTHLNQMRDMLIKCVLERIPGAYLTGSPENRLPSHASFVFEDIESNTLLMHLDMKGIAASAASACKTGNPEPSGVLLAMGYPRELASGSLRLTVGKDTTADEVQTALGVLEKTITRLRKLEQDVTL